MLEMTKAYLSPGVWRLGVGRLGVGRLGVGRLGVGRLGIRLAIAAAVLLPLGAFSAQADEVKVTIDNFTFTPPELKLKVGDTVTWTNHDDIPHTVVSAGKFRSKTMDTDNTFAFTFAAAGDYKYFCSLHPHMTGTIKVE
jgi:plastocyanin